MNSNKCWTPSKLEEKNFSICQSLSSRIIENTYLEMHIFQSKTSSTQFYSLNKRMEHMIGNKRRLCSTGPYSCMEQHIVKEKIALSENSNSKLTTVKRSYLCPKERQDFTRNSCQIQTITHIAALCIEKHMSIERSHWMPSFRFWLIESATLKNRLKISSIFTKFNTQLWVLTWNSKSKNLTLTLNRIQTRDKDCWTISLVHQQWFIIPKIISILIEGEF